jgi:hypothetical protein
MNKVFLLSISLLFLSFDLCALQRDRAHERTIVKAFVLAMLKHDFIQESIIERAEIQRMQREENMDWFQALEKVFHLHDKASAKYAFIKCMNKKPKKPFMI